jgi:hypothetical protein
MALLREIFGPGAEKVRRFQLLKYAHVSYHIGVQHMLCMLPSLLQVKVESRPWSMELPSGRKLEVELTTLSSNYHIEMNPSDVGNNDRYVVQVGQIMNVLDHQRSCVVVFFHILVA